MSTEQNKQIARRYFEESSGRQYDELVAPDYVGNFAGFPEPIRGIEGVKQIDALYRASFPDVVISVREMVAEGDTVAVRYQINGSHTGAFQGIPASGKKISIDGIHILRLKDGKIVEEHAVFDNLSLLQQIGAIPTPGQPAA